MNQVHAQNNLMSPPQTRFLTSLQEREMPTRDGLTNKEGGDLLNFEGSQLRQASNEVSVRV